jgi:hypothetical protein
MPMLHAEPLRVQRAKARLPYLLTRLLQLLCKRLHVCLLPAHDSLLMKVSEGTSEPGGGQ